MAQSDNTLVLSQGTADTGPNDQTIHFEWRHSHSYLLVKVEWVGEED